MKDDNKDDIFYSDEDIERFEEDDEPESEIYGYECLGCGTTFAEDEVSEGDYCPVCGGMCLSALYE